MNNNIETFLVSIREQEGETFKVDNESISNEYQTIDNNQSSLAIKILSIFGGIFGMIIFLVALAVSSFFDDGIGFIILGSVFFLAALIINRTTTTIFLDTISVSSFVVGFILWDFGLFDLEFEETSICLFNMLVALIALILSRNYIYTFLSILVFQISSLFLITFNDAHNLVHAYIGINITILTAWILNEAQIITSSKALARIYAPVRIGLIFSVIIGLGLIGIKGFYFNIDGVNLIWISSISTILIMLYLISIILKTLEINSIRAKVIVFIISALILESIIYAPAISGAMVLLLLCFYTNYKTGIAINIIALVYFVGQYYYDLNLTLLNKSIILFSSGILFLILYFLTHKKLMSNETH
jgi:hypothetical protein